MSGVVVLEDDRFLVDEPDAIALDVLDRAGRSFVRTLISYIPSPRLARNRPIGPSPTGALAIATWKSPIQTPPMSIWKFGAGKRCRSSGTSEHAVSARRSSRSLTAIVISWMLNSSAIRPFRR